MYVSKKYRDRGPKILALVKDRVFVGDKKEGVRVRGNNKKVLKPCHL